MALLVLGGCTNTVAPPVEVPDSVDVFLLDHGRTSSLVLPHGRRLARYSYGEWGWYARNRTGLMRASGTLFSDTRAAVGRRLFVAEPTVSGIRRTLRVPIEQAWAIRVPAHRAEHLAAELDALFRTEAERAVDNPLMGLTFVPHPQSYSLGHNSNHMTAGWLRRLECRVVTRGPFSRWEVVRDDAASGTD